MSSSKVVLVTGANQGLGLAIIQVAALRHPAWTFLLGSRDAGRGAEAIRQLRDLGVQAPVEVVPLDVTKDAEISAAVETVRSKYGKLDVLVNNAGINLHHPAPTLPDIRAKYNSIFNVNVSSVAVIAAAFAPLLHASASPKVVNVSSRLGSIENTLTQRVYRDPAYGASKVGVNGLTAHLQVAENDRVEAEEGSQTASAAAAASGKPLIRYFACTPGLLKTAFTRFIPQGRSPEEGAEVVVALMADDEGRYQGGTFWEFEEGRMWQVPW